MRAALIALGAVMMGFAVLGAATDPDLKPGGVVLFLVAVLIAHDAVLLPVTIAAGALLARFAPPWARPGVRAAAIVTLAVGVVALPLVLGYGRAADNPSVLPLDYGLGLILVLTLTWTTALASTVLARYRANRRKGPPRPTLTSNDGGSPRTGNERRPGPRPTIAPRPRHPTRRAGDEVDPCPGAGP